MEREEGNKQMERERREKGREEERLHLITCAV